MIRLSDDLVATLGAGGSVLTARPQQAVAIRAAWADLQRSQGLRIWSTPDALAFGPWLGRVWNEAYGREGNEDLPRLLTAAQERALWESIVGDDAAAASYLQPFGAARAAQRAWRLAHDWSIPLDHWPEHYGEEAITWLRWAQAFVERTRAQNWIDGARAMWRWPLPGPHVAGPWTAIGFDSVSPALRELARRCQERGGGARIVQSVPVLGHAVRTALADAQAEVVAAACWARAVLGRTPQARLLIIVPDLERRRASVARVFDEQLLPSALLLAGSAAPRPYAEEGGSALDRYGLIATALAALELASGPRPFAELSEWLRSPYLAVPAQLRARLDAELRALAPLELDLYALLAILERQAQKWPWSSELARAVRAFCRALEGPRRSLSHWSEVFGTALALLGWPGARLLDSAEYQTADKWNATLGELATLDGIYGQVDRARAVSCLRQLVAQADFQPQSGDVPVTITAALSEPVTRYDGVWICGLEAAAWPRAARPDPFIPWSLQRAAGVPGASAAATLEQAQTITVGLLGSAEQVIASWPRQVDEESGTPSPLIAALTEVDAGTLADAACRLQRTIQVAARIEQLRDEIAPPLPRPATLRGGARALRMQSSCPFRGFADQRLLARPLEEPAAGIDPRTRGILVHRALERLWGSLGSLHALRARSAAEVTALLDGLVTEVCAETLERPRRWSAALIELEAQRLSSLLQQWLALELTRAPFTVVAREEAMPWTIAGCSFEFRLDRIDQLGDGRQLVIDYKTGERDIDERDWSGERPRDPQMPLYALACEANAHAVACGVLNATGCEFTGVSAAPPAIGTLEPVDDWRQQLTDWRAALTALMEEFASGVARVEPRDDDTCRLCRLQALCRIDELRVGHGDA